ncbi:MAG: hypothetical protein FWG63_09105 [Defluviitaleaceae bacterium]|nr:hypothetical protein [Defluviitaleaceae bacterium]
MPIFILLLFIPIFYKISVTKDEGNFAFLFAIPLFCKISVTKHEEGINTNIWIFSIKLKAKEKKQKKEATDVPEEPDLEYTEPTEPTEPIQEPTKNEKSEEKKGKIKDYYKLVLELWGKKETLNLVMGLVMELFKKIFKVIKPKHFTLQAEVGIGIFGTGMLMAVVHAISPSNLDITGNFTERVINVKLQANGRLFLYEIVWPFVAFLFKKPIRQLIMGVRT